MPSPALLTLVATLLPLAGFLMLLLAGKRMGALLAGWVATALAVASFACTLLAMVKWYEGKHGLATWGFQIRPIERTFGWLAGGGAPLSTPAALSVGVYVDSLTIAMFSMITLVAVIVHIRGISLLRNESCFSRFYAFLGLSCFAILGLAISATLIQVLLFWEILSFCTYLLITCGVEKRKASAAALRVIVVHCIGDGAMLLGAGLLISKLGTARFTEIWTMLRDASRGQSVVLAGGVILSTSFLTATGLCLFGGAIVKSALFPVQWWLGDAAEAPAPALAMICTTTTVAAGAYLVARLFPILTPEARLLIAIVGVTTLTAGACVALVQTDLQRVLAWSTVSQMGYVFLALGAGSWVGGLFHLITHSFFKSVLFLGGGSVIAAMGGRRELSQFGGLLRKMPVIAGAFAVAVLAMAGTPWLSGRASQSMIAIDSAAFSLYAVGPGGRARAYWVFFLLPAAVAYLTAFYMARCWMLTFAGKPRNIAMQAQATEHAASWAPLLVLLVPTVIAGHLMNVPELLHASIVETRAACANLLNQNNDRKDLRFTGFDQAWAVSAVPVIQPEGPGDSMDSTGLPALPASSAASASGAFIAHERGRALARTGYGWAWAIGLTAGIAFYWRGDLAARYCLRFRPLRWIHAWLYSGMYFEELYRWTVVNLILGLGQACSAIDRYVISGPAEGINRYRRRRLRALRLTK